jgi:hypothetical protein
MAEITPDQALLATYKVSDGVNTAFVNRVMESIESTQQSHFFATLRHMPKFALIIAAIVGVLVISGTAYAAYQLWLKPHVSVQQFEPNQQGRQEALVAFQNCKDTKNARYEVKNGAGLNAEKVEQLLQARCEMDAINEWAYNTHPTKVDVPPIAYPGAFTVIKIDGNDITLDGTTEDITVTTNDKTMTIIDGIPAGMSSLKVGDTVTFVQKYTYNRENGQPTSRELLGVITLQLPGEFYETTMQNMVAKRAECHGNTTESCVQGSSIDVYPRNGESNAAPVEPGERFELQGRIVEHDGKTVRLKASSGAIYTINAPTDIIENFNTQHGPNYGGLRIEVGDMLSVLYTKKWGEDPKNVNANQLRTATLLVEMLNKQDGYKKY